VRWFEAVYFTSPLTMEYLQKFKPQKHVLVEDQRLIDLADVQLDTHSVNSMTSSLVLLK
jgi:hypothetical protein